MLALLERYLIYILATVTLTLSLFFEWDYSLLNDYKFLFSNIISITSIAIGFLATILFQLWSYKQKKLMHYFRKHGYYKLLKLYSIEAVTYLIILVFLSLVLGIYIDSYLFISNGVLLTSIYNFILTSSFFSLLKIIILFFKINKLIEIYDKDNSNLFKQHPPKTYHFDNIK